MFEAPLNLVLPVWLKDNKKARRGADGYYHHLTGDLGVKVYRQPDDDMAESEYLLTCYAYETTKMAAEALGLGRAKVLINGKVVSRPAIFMKHIEGQNVVDYARELGWLHNHSFDKDEAEAWGYESPDFVEVADRINTVCMTLQEYGFTCHDHMENFGNFMRNQKTGKVSAIDFSVETENEEACARAYDLCYRKLAIAIPAEYIDILYRRDVLVLN